MHSAILIKPEESHLSKFFVADFVHLNRTRISIFLITVWFWPRCLWSLWYNSHGTRSTGLCPIQRDILKGNVFGNCRYLKAWDTQAKQMVCVHVICLSTCKEVCICVLYMVETFPLSDKLGWRIFYFTKNKDFPVNYQASVSEISLSCYNPRSHLQ